MIDPIQDETVTPPVKPFRREGLGYVYEPRGAGILLRADYIDQGKSDITAEIIVEATTPGVPPHLLRTRINLLVDARLNDLAKQLAVAVPRQDGWLQTVRTFSEGVIRAERAGEPFTLVGNRPTRLRPPDLVERIVVAGKATMLYAPGGVGKGYLATGMAVCVQTGMPFVGYAVQRTNVLYLDWEDDADEADDRIKEVCRGFRIEPPDIHYRWMSSPLHQNVQPLARYISKNEIGLVIVDSFELAAGGSEYGTYDEAAKKLYRALRMLGPVSSLLIDHVSESARQNKTQVNKAYGALMKGNWARRAFEVKADIRDRINHLGLYTFKTNRGESSAPIGIAVDFTTPGVVQFYREDIRDNPELNQALPIVQRITHILQEQGRLTANDLSEADGAPVKEITHCLKLYRNKRFKSFADETWGVLMPQVIRDPHPLALVPNRDDADDIVF